MHIMSPEEVSKIKPEPQQVMNGDLLDIAKINALPQPIMAVLFGGGGEYEIETIDVQTGCMRIMVCGLVEPMHFSDAKTLIDVDGSKHDPDDFWIE